MRERKRERETERLREIESERERETERLREIESERDLHCIKAVRINLVDKLWLFTSRQDSQNDTPRHKRTQAQYL